MYCFIVRSIKTGTQQKYIFCCKKYHIFDLLGIFIARK